VCYNTIRFFINVTHTIMSPINIVEDNLLLLLLDLTKNEQFSNTNVIKKYNVDIIFI
jgi:hypothetical protein